MSDYIVKEWVTRELSLAEAASLVDELRAVLGSLAVGNFMRDEAVLAYAACVESMFHNRGRTRMPSYDALLTPALDHIVPRYPSDSQVSEPTRTAILVAQRWLRPSEQYHAVVGGIINLQEGRMTGGLSNTGRILLYPSSSFDAELRNRWFIRRLHDVRELAGEDILDDGPATTGVVARIDRAVRGQGGHLRNGRYFPPLSDWYRDHVNGIADRTLELHFAHVGASEDWAGTSKTETMSMLRPFYRRAAWRLFGHIRAFSFCRKAGATFPILTSCVEVSSIEELVADSSNAAGVPEPKARAVIDSMIRRGKEEKYGILPYPLIPLASNRVAFLPSTILFAGWPAIREKAIAATMHGNTSITSSRDHRHLQQLEDALRNVGIKHVSTDVAVKDLTDGHLLTDLDVVAVDSDLRCVLVTQLKSFLTPSNLHEVRRADDNVDKALAQCDVAANNRAAVQIAVEKRLGIKLEPTWVLRQFVAVEAITGIAEPSKDHPAVSVEWLLARVSALRVGGSVEAIWRDARDLPDAIDFVSSVRPAFEIFTFEMPDGVPPKRVAVFAYGTGDD